MTIILITGPQSSGKTTLFNYLKNQYPKARFQPEINPYSILAKHSGSAFVTEDLQTEISRLTIKQFRAFSNLPQSTLILWETGFMNLAYMQRDLKPKNYSHFKNLYLKLAHSTDMKAIFIDTKPQVSWQRRKDIYLNRVKHYLEDNQITDPNGQKKVTTTRMAKYKDNLYLMYPLFKQAVKILNLPTYVVQNNNGSLESFLKQARQIVDRIKHD